MSEDSRRRFKPEDFTNHTGGVLHSKKPGSHPDQKTAFKPEHHTVHPAPIGKAKETTVKSGIKNARSDEGMKMPKPDVQKYHSEPDGDETKAEATKPMKKGTTVTVSKPADIPTKNTPGRSYNTKTHPVVKEGMPSLPAGETEGGGAKTTAGDPSFSPISSANAAHKDADMHFHIHVANK
jgi:hypothetical protein